MISNKSNIINLNTNQKTMSSLEISKLTGKEHSKVKADINRILKDVEIDVAQFGGIYRDSMNRTNNLYNLPKMECDLVISSYSSKYRLAIIKRWQELERQQPEPQFTLPTNFIEALECLVTSEKEKAVALQVIEDQKPAMLVYDRLADRKTDVSTTVLAKHLGITATKLNKFLRNEGIKFIKRDLPTAKYSEWFNIISDSKNGHDYSQCLVTDLGFIEITKLWGDQ